MRNTLQEVNMSHVDVAVQSNRKVNVTIGHLQNTVILFVCALKFYTSIVSSFSWDFQLTQEKTMLMQNLGAQTKSITVFCEMAYSKYEQMQ